MYCFRKDRTFLSHFDQTTKRGYDKIGGKKYLFWLITYLISLAVQIIPIIAIVFTIGIILAKTPHTPASMDSFISSLSIPWAHWISLAPPTALVIFSFFLYVRFIEKRPFASIGLRSNQKVKKYLIGAAIAIVMQLFYFSVVLIFGWAEVVSQPIHASYALGISAFGYVFLFLIGFMIQGASEEVVVRGWMLPVLSRHYKVSTGIILSSLFFAFLHIFNPNINVLSLVNLILYGLFAALYALHDGGLWGIFAQHSIWNWFMGNVLGLPVSGMIIGRVSLIETQLTGPIWLTGGSFGPEGGIIVTFIFSISILILIKLLMNKGILTKRVSL